jgi:hypothetical protein
MVLKMRWKKRLTPTPKIQLLKEKCIIMHKKLNVEANSLNLDFK